MSNLSNLIRKSIENSPKKICFKGKKIRNYNGDINLDFISKKGHSIPKKKSM